MQVEFVKELEDKVIYLQSSGNKYTVIECERIEEGDINPIPVRQKSFPNLKKAIEVMDKWSGTS